MFGMKKPLDQRVTDEDLYAYGLPTASYAPDGTAVHSLGRVGMGYQPYHTHLRSNMHNCPTIDRNGNLLTFDGRIDNFLALCYELGKNAAVTSDAAIVLNAFERWGSLCFSKFVGDWALTLWVASESTLYLARDHAGSRTLYFQNCADTVRWATYIDTLVDNQQLDEAYAACYSACQRLGEQTPYHGITLVPAGHYLEIRDSSFRRVPHWSWVATNSISYESAADYDHHFVELFRQAVSRRIAPGARILSHLSGGVDSTSIVCMSDSIRRGEGATVDGLIDTISFYDDTEPNWNEEPYFTATERARGKRGFHVGISFAKQNYAAPMYHDGDYASHLWPGIDDAYIQRELAVRKILADHEYRVVLSGIGGDELLGGVPTPLPELADYLSCLKIRALMSKGIAWCLETHTPIVHMLYDTAVFWIAQRLPWLRFATELPPWLTNKARRMCLGRRREEAELLPTRGALPSAISNGEMWWLLQETLPHLLPSPWERPEFRYPYLDRDLVDFLFTIPRRELLRPGRRRWLMRRALRDLVPELVIERPRKAFLDRGPLVALENHQTTLRRLFASPALADYGLIDPAKLTLAFGRLLESSDLKWLSPIISTVNLEIWLRGNPTRTSTPAYDDSLVRGEPAISRIH
jgi:asparagine synthase (glutamine-hydrolysing)